MQLFAGVLSANDIDDLAARADQPLSTHIASTFERLASSESDQERKAAIGKLAHFLFLSYSFDPSKHAHPFGKDTADVIRERISDEDVDALSQIVPQLTMAELRAFLSDILWCRSRRNPEIARLAVRSYIESARRIENIEQWVTALDRVERALRLGRSLGYEDAAHAIAVEYSRELISKYSAENFSFLIPRLIEILNELNVGSPSDYIGTIRNFGERAYANRNYRGARICYEQLVKLLQKNGDAGGADSALVEIAGTFQAEAILCEASKNYLMAVHYFTQAIQICRRSSGGREKIAALRVDLRRVERASMNEMKIIKGDTIDITDFIVSAKEKVSGKEFRLALLHLAHIIPIVDANQVKESASRAAKISLVRRIAGTSIVDDEGRTVGRSNPISDEEITFSDMVVQIHTMQNFYVQARIFPALEQFNFEHVINLRDLASLVSHSEFVPEGQEGIFAKGLLSGFEMDFMASTHLLVPQVENSLRHLMEERGLIITKLDNYGVQRHLDLTELLFDERIAEILSEGVIFDLRALFIDNRGPNLRHRLAHGLLSGSEFMSSECVYAWWLILRLCYFDAAVKAPEPVDKGRTSP